MGGDLNFQNLGMANFDTFCIPLKALSLVSHIVSAK